MSTQPFSKKLQIWLKSDGPKTFGSLEQAFGEKSFAIIILVLMFIPALPLPTGGISHVFGVITMILAAEMVAGRKTVWLPKWARGKSLGKVTEDKAVPFIIRRISWLEKYSRPRLSYLATNKAYLSAVGVVIFILAFFAAFAPPFTGLDTLPSMGVVVVCMALILEDVALLPAGILIGAIGIGIEIGFGLGLSLSLWHRL